MSIYLLQHQLCCVLFQTRVAVPESEVSAANILENQIKITIFTVTSVEPGKTFQQVRLLLSCLRCFKLGQQRQDVLVESQLQHIHPILRHETRSFFIFMSSFDEQLKFLLVRTMMDDCSEDVGQVSCWFLILDQCFYSNWRI